MAAKGTKSDAPVAAQDAKDAAEADVASAVPSDETISEQEKAQAEQLKAGQNGVAKDGPTVAHNRSTGANAQGVQGGFIDQMSRRDMSDALEGHFCTVDRTHKDVDENQLPPGEDGFGVYESPAVTDEDGYPVTANVRLRGNVLITVPYEALRPAESRGV